MLISAHAVAMTAEQAHMLARYYAASRPASVQANPTILAFSIFGLFGGSIVALDTLYRIWHMVRLEPFPWRHPVTAERLVIGGFFLSLLLYIGPDAVGFMSWPDVEPTTRRTISLVNRWCDFAAIVPLAAASVLWIYAQPTISYQLRRQPIPVDNATTWDKLKRPLWIGSLLLFASVALSFGR